MIQLYVEWVKAIVVYYLLLLESSIPRVSEPSVPQLIL